MTLTVGYATTHTEAFTITGTPAPTVTLNNNHGGRITWNAVQNRLDIAAGLSAGNYTVTLTATNGIMPTATHTFTLTVVPQQGGNGSNQNGGSGNQDTNDTVSTTDPTDSGETPTTPDTSTNAEIYIREEELIYLSEQNEGVVIEEDGITLYIPNEVIRNLFDADNPESISAEVTVNHATHVEGYEDLTAGYLLTVEVNITVGEDEIEETAVPFTVSVSLEDFDFEDVNIHRIVAIAEDGTILGGRLDPVTGLFTFETQYTGTFTIAYVESLIRISLNINSPIIYDLAANSQTQHMDVLPIIQDGRTLLPIRFITYALGAEVDWSRATDYSPSLVHITLNGQTLSFPASGIITPELAALGMDVPLIIYQNRTMVPLRFISEFFGAIVNWDNQTQDIEIIRDARTTLISFIHAGLSGVDQNIYETY